MPVPTEPTTPLAPAGPDPKKVRVALCEPDGMLFALFGEWLQRARFQPSGCASRAGAACVVLVVADVPMPPRRGAAWITILRRRFPNARVLAISGQFLPGMSGATGAARALGADAVLAKPFSHGQFIEQVRALT
jgi:DNA-binding response OmpR family regulator